MTGFLYNVKQRTSWLVPALVTAMLAVVRDTVNVTFGVAVG